jgi:small subunit ribosomal protein S17
MAEQNDNTEAQGSDEEPTSDAPHASAPDADPSPEPESAAASEAEEQEPEGAETPEAAADEVPQPEAPDTREEAALEPEVPAKQPAEALTPKERKRRAKAAKAAEIPAREPRSSEERQAERIARRQRKAQIRRVGRERARAKARANGGSAQATPPREHQPGVQKTRQGVVVSDSPDKTITVRIDVTRRHREYKKIVRTSSTLHVHDEGNDAHVGDTVVIRECRPLSRTKRWRLLEVVERAK